MGKKKNRYIGDRLNAEKPSETGEVEVQEESTEETPVTTFDTEAVVEEAVLEAEVHFDADFEVEDEAEDCVLSEDEVLINNTPKDKYSGLKGKIVQDLGSAYKLETELGTIIIPKSRCNK